MLSYKNQNLNWQEQGSVWQVADGVAVLTKLVCFVAILCNVKIVIVGAFFVTDKNVSASWLLESGNILDPVELLQWGWLELLFATVVVGSLFGVCFVYEAWPLFKQNVYQFWVAVGSKLYFYSTLCVLYLLLSSFLVVITFNAFDSVWLNTLVLLLLLTVAIVFILLNVITGWLDRLHYACNLAYGCFSLNSSLTALLYTLGLRVLAVGTMENSLIIANLSIVCFLTKVYEIPNITADFDGVVTSARHIKKWHLVPAVNREIFAELYADLHQPRVHEDLLNLVEIFNRDPVKGVQLLNDHRYRYAHLCKNDYLTNKLGRSYLIDKLKLIREDSLLARWAFGDATTFEAAMYNFGPAFNVIAESGAVHPHQILFSSGNPNHPLHRRGDVFVVKSLNNIGPELWAFYKFHARYEWEVYGIELKDSTGSPGDSRKIFHSKQGKKSASSEVFVLTQNVPGWFENSLLAVVKQAAKSGGLTAVYSTEVVQYIKLLNFVKESPQLEKAITCNSWIDVDRVRAAKIHKVFKPVFNYRHNVSLTVSDTTSLNPEQMQRVVRLASLTDVTTYKRAYANIYGRLFQNEANVHRAFDFASAGIRAVIRGMKIGR